MQQWQSIRHRVLVEGVSKRQIMRETGMHWQTLEKILNYSSPPGYREKKPRPKSKLAAHVDFIQDIIENDKAMPRKQRHTATRIFHRLLKEHGYTGGYTILRELIREIKQSNREVYMPLVHHPGEAQVDYFYALARMDGKLRKVTVFVMALPFSDMFFVRAYERECTESFWDGHIKSFEFFGGVPTRISYDNLRIAVRAITGCHKRKLTHGFLELASHYLFNYHFCNVRRANEKGVVEGMAKYARLNFMVPVPEVKDFDHLNQILREDCWKEQFRKLRGKGAKKGELWGQDQSAFGPIPEAPFDACRKRSARANSLSLVRMDSNDYSVPVRYGHHEVIVKAYVDTIWIHTRSGEKIASHKRIWQKEQVSYDPLHYIPLLWRKPGALDFAYPFIGFELPECFSILRRRLENLSEITHTGTKEYIRVLQLLIEYPIERVAEAITKALRCNAPNRDVVALYCHPDEQPQDKIFCLDGREHLKYVEVATTDVRTYTSLLEHKEY